MAASCIETVIVTCPSSSCIFLLHSSKDSWSVESEEEEDASKGGADGGVGGGLGRSASADPNWVLARPNSSSRMMATILSWFSSLPCGKENLG